LHDILVAAVSIGATARPRDLDFVATVGPRLALRETGNLNLAREYVDIRLRVKSLESGFRKSIEIYFLSCKKID
jgi:hypothetical protein